jgi:predicted AlkP superfamily pyrophosphatase or phosphodiesterase
MACAELGDDDGRGRLGGLEVRMLHALFAAAALSLSASGSTPPERVLMVSIDALHPAALTAQTMPAVARWASRGRLTLDGRSTRPPKTLIAHTAMLTGLSPERSGKTDNAWEEGAATVRFPTILDDARAAGYRTAFFYSKEKLGFLVTPGVQVHALAPDDGVARGRAFLAERGRAFLLLHLSGLEYAGMESGWLSPEYLAEATAIDRALAPLLEELERRGSYLVVITSDHAGHAREHGTAHPEDGRRPLAMRSDGVRLPALDAGAAEITALRSLLVAALIGDRR